MANIPAPRGYFPPQTNLRVAEPAPEIGFDTLPSNPRDIDFSSFSTLDKPYSINPYQFVFGDSKRILYQPTESPLDPTMAAIASRTTQPLATPTSVAMPTAPLARSRFLQERQGVPLPRPRPEGMPPSGMDQLRAAQLRMPARGTPADAGLRAAASTGLQLSGYQDRPMTLGQGLGAMLGAYTEAEQAAEQRKAAEQQQALANQLALAGFQLDVQKAMQPDLTSAEKNALAMGLERGTPEFNDFIERSAIKPETSVFIGGDKQKELAYNSALETRADMKKQVNQDRELATRLQTVIDLINSGVETGRVQSALMPVKQIARELGILDEDQLKTLSDQEIIDSAAAFLTPRMRVVGSGASSDRDMDFFARATVRMANTPDANLVIATMQKQVMDYNNKRLNLFDQYVEEKGHDFGFGEYADTEMGSVYHRVESNEQFNELIDEGKITKGDVFWNNITSEFDIYDPEEMG